MQRLLRWVLFSIFIFNGAKKTAAQCNPVIFGEDTICTGSSSYLYVNDVYQSYSWSNGSTASYTYATGPGTITLNTVDANSCNGSASILIRQVQPPSVSFTANAGGYVLSTTNTSTNAYAYQWIFGDNTTSNAISPTHLYSRKGNYTVCLNSVQNFCPAESYCRSVTIGTSLGMPTDSVFLKLFNLELFNLNKVVQNPIDSGYLIAAQFDNCGECSSPMLIKTNKNGEVQWSRNFDYLYDVMNIEYFDSGYVFLSNNSEFSLTKTDLNGNIQWQKYDGVFGDKMLFTFSNTRVGLIINKDPLEVIIYDENGNITSQKSYTLGGWDMSFTSFAKTSDGKVILNGKYGYDFPGPGGVNHVQYDSYDQVAAKMDVNGDFIWLNGIYQNTACSQNGQPLENSSGQYLFPGRFYEPTASTYYYYISRFDASGNYMDSYSIDSLKGDYSMFLSPSNNVVVVSRPEAPVYDSLRIITMDNSFNVLSTKKVTAYNCSRSTKTYDGYVATAFTYFDGSTFREFPALYKTSLSGNSACLDGNIPPVTYPAFPYVYGFTVSNTAPAYTDTDVSEGCAAKIYDDSSACRTCNVTATIQVTAGDTMLCAGETVTLSAPANMYEYVWNNGAHTRTITVSAAGTYTVVVYDYRGCSATASKQVRSGVVYNILFATNAPNGLCEGSSYSIHAYDSAFQSVWGITWNTGVSGPFVFPDSSGTFVTTFVDQFGCPSVDSITVTLQPLPPVPAISGLTDVCNGDSVQLCASFTDNGSGPYTFSWNSGVYTDSCIYSAGGNYTLAVTNRFGCDTAGTTTHTVTPHPAPDPNLQPQDSAFICPGSSVTISAAGGFNSYLWSNNATTSSITVNSAGTYSVTVTDGTVCPGTESITVYSGISYNPVFALDTTNGFCEGTSISISAHDSLSQPVNNYVWSTGSTASSISVSSSNTYSVTFTDANGCSATENISIQMHPVAPALSVTGNSDVCAGATVALCASFTGNNSGPYSFNWNNGAYTDSCINVSGGSYSLVLTNAYGCSSAAAIHPVIAHATPSPSIQPAGNVFICAGTDTILCAATGFSSYLWSNGATVNCITVTGGNYTLSVTDNFGCTGSDTVTVSESTALVPNIQPSGVVLVCAGSDTTICVDPGFASYTWSDGSTQSCISVPAGNYIVTVTDNSGCTGTDSVTINDLVPPVANIQPSGTLVICSGADTLICADPGFAAYAWSDGSTLNCINASNGIYTVTVTDSYGCTAMDSVSVSQGTIPDPDIQPAGTIYVCPGADTLLCAAAGFGNYLWSNGATSNCITATAGVYSIRVTDVSGCMGADSVVVADLPAPLPNIPYDTVLVCAGTDTLLCADAGFTGYLWSTGATANCIVAPSGNYTVSVTDNSGCAGLDTVTVVDRIPPFPAIQPSGNILVCAGSDTMLCASAGFATYLWSEGSTGTCIIAAAGNYNVIVHDNNGCTGIDFVSVTDYQPAQPLILSDDAPFDTLFSNSANGNQWFEAGVGAIPGAVFNYFVPTHNASYFVVVTDSNGCASISSDTTDFVYAYLPASPQTGSLNIFPNPAHDQLHITFSDAFHTGTEMKIVLYDVIGQIVAEYDAAVRKEMMIDISSVAPAVYVIEIRSGDQSVVTRIEKW